MGWSWDQGFGADKWTDTDVYFELIFAIIFVW